MRVAMLVANPIVFDGRVMRHAQALCEAGHEVTVLGVLGPADRDGPLPEGSRFRSWRLDRRRRGLLPRALWIESALRQRAAMRLCERLGEGPLSRLPLVAPLAVATSAPELAARAAALRCDVVHGNDLNTLPAAAWAAGARGVPYLYDAHELYVDELPTLSDAERRARRVTEGRYARRAAAVLTVNELIAEELVTMYGVAPPVVVRNLPPLRPGVDPAAPPPPPDGAPLRLLYHGANVGLGQQGTDDILRAMARLRDRQPVQLTVRGRMSEAEEAEWRARAAELGLRPEQLRICPPVPGAGALIEAAIAGGEELGLAVHPPLCGSYRYTTSSKIYEYQGAGLAVVCTDVVGNHLCVDERAGAFYPAGDDERLAAILLSLARDRAALRRMRAAGRRRAEEELCWERERGRLLGVYEQLGQHLAARG